MVSNLHYIKGTPDQGVLYENRGHTQIDGYSDADCARCSTSGYCVFIGGDARAFTTTIGNSTLIVQNLDTGGCKTFGSSKRPFLDFIWDSKGVMVVVKA